MRLRRGKEREREDSPLLVIVVTAAGNLLVCLAIARERKLQNTTNYFLMSLAIADCLVAILVMPMAMIAEVLGKTSPGARARLFSRAEDLL